ncbi:hypothetical protein M0802_008752 [Mischocyttarus mexicanus]|nr:hypothetical protein M0802_008752 [Mischocyttarus mexicanus]
MYIYIRGSLWIKHLSKEGRSGGRRRRRRRRRRRATIKTRLTSSLLDHMPTSVQQSFDDVLTGDLIWYREDDARDFISRQTGKSYSIMSSNISTNFIILLLLGLVSFIFAASIKQEEPANVECHNSKECPDDHCCVLGGGRYTIPHCSPMIEKAETCRPNSELLNTTLHYPNNSKLTITDVHYILCPCSKGLICDPKEGVCTSND